MIHRRPQIVELPGVKVVLDVIVGASELISSLPHASKGGGLSGLFLSLGSFSLAFDGLFLYGLFLA